MGRDLDAYFTVNGKMVYPLPTFVATSFASPTASNVKAYNLLGC